MSALSHGVDPSARTTGQVVQILNAKGVSKSKSFTETPLRLLRYIPAHVGLSSTNSLTSWACSET